MIRFLKRAEAKEEQVLAPLVVLFETICVLESACSRSGEEIVEAIAAMRRMPVLRFEEDGAVQAVRYSRHSSADLSDTLIAHSAHLSGADEVLTFDRKAARQPLLGLMH